MVEVTGGVGGMSAKEPDMDAEKQLKNFLALKAKVIHTDELIRRYREKEQECTSLQEQLQSALGQEMSLKQSLVGLRAEVNALMKEKESLQDALTTSQLEKEAAERRATNAELVVSQLTAQLEGQSRAEAGLIRERDRFSEECLQLQAQLKKALRLPLSGRRCRHHSFSSLSLTTSPPELPLQTVCSLPEDDHAHFGRGEPVGAEPSNHCLTQTVLDLSLSDSENGDERTEQTEESELQHPGSSPLHPAQQTSTASPPLSPLVHAAADTMNSDSDSELSLSEVESLSPIPPSPQPRPPTLSPLPLSPARQPLSPLPTSPPPPPSLCHVQPSQLPLFISGAPASCSAPVPSVSVSPSPSPIVPSFSPHNTTLQCSHLSPFSSTNLQPISTSSQSSSSTSAQTLLDAPQNKEPPISQEMDTAAKVAVMDGDVGEETGAEIAVAVLEDGEMSVEEQPTVQESEKEDTEDSTLPTSPHQADPSLISNLSPPDSGAGLSKECTQKRRASDVCGGPEQKSIRLTAASASKNQDVCGSASATVVQQEKMATQSVAVEVFQESVPDPSARVGYSQDPTIQSSSGASSSLQTDGATGQTEEPPSHSLLLSSVPPLGELLAQSPLQPVARETPSSVDPALTPSVLQQSLNADLQCPLALPEWLVASMVRVQSMLQHHPCSFRRKKGYLGGRRQPKQKSSSYVSDLVERLFCGQLPLPAAVKLFSDSWNCSNPSVLCRSLVNFLQTCYMPRFEHVTATFNTLCSDVKSKALENPRSISFPPALLRPECQLIALLYHSSKLNSSMAQLLPEIASALYSAVLSPQLTFHRMAAISRLFTAICRLLVQPDRVIFLACDLLRRPLSLAELPVISGMAGVWPLAFARPSDVKLVVAGRLNPAGVEAQPLSYAVEVVVTAMMRQSGQAEHLISKLHTLCQWSTGQTITAKTADKLTSVLLQLLQTSGRVTVEQEPCQGWFRPRPSQLTFQLVQSLRLLSWFKGWIWASDVLVKAHMWPILQAWNSKRESVPEATVMAVVRLLGFIGQQCVEPACSSWNQLQKVLLSLLLRQEIPLSVQLCAAESLIDLCPPHLPTSQEAVAVVWQWLRGLARHPAGPHLSREFCPKLCRAAPHLRSPSSSEARLSGRAVASVLSSSFGTQHGWKSSNQH